MRASFFLKEKPVTIGVGGSLQVGNQFTSRVCGSANPPKLGGGQEVEVQIRMFIRPPLLVLRSQVLPFFCDGFCDRTVYFLFVFPSRVHLALQPFGAKREYKGVGRTNLGLGAKQELELSTENNTW